jgi:hypothetical protein
VDQPLVQQRPEHDRHATDAIQSDHVVLAEWPQVTDVGGAPADPVEILQRQFHLRLVGDRGQMQHRVGRSPQRHHSRDRILECGTGHDLAGTKLVLEESHHCLSGLDGVVPQTRVDCGNGGRAGQRHSDRFTDRGHRVRSEHPCAGSSSRTGIALDLEHLGGGDPLLGQRSDGFEHVDDVDVPIPVTPGSDDPPYKKTDGRFVRAAAINMPGSDLSQPAIVTIASNRSPCMTSSTESAMTSRDTSEARMPSCPIEMPSETATVVNVSPTPPLATTPSFAFSASSGPVTLHGVTSFPAETSPT